MRVRMIILREAKVQRTRGKVEVEAKEAVLLRKDEADGGNAK